MKLLRLGGTSLLAGITQGLGLLQLMLLLLPPGASRPSDAYFFMVVWSQIPTQIILIGMLYPVWLRGSHMSRWARRSWLWATPLLCGIAAIVSALLFESLAGGYELLTLHSVMFAILGTISAVGWAYALRLSADGKPHWLVSVTLVPNLFACIVLVLAQLPQPETRVSAMVLAQIGGMLVFLSAIVLKNRSAFAHRSSRIDVAEQKDSAAKWYLTQSVAGYGGNLVLQTQAATLPESSLSIIGLISRFLTGATSVVTNAVVPRLIHSGSTSGANVYRYLHVTTTCVAFGAVLILVLRESVPIQLAGSALLLLAWFEAASLNASLKRVVTKFLPPRIALITVISSLVIPVLLVVIGTTGELTLSLVLTALVALDFVPGVLLAMILKRWLLAGTSTAIVIVCLTLALPMLN